jgi:hypothetical protein
LNTASDWVLTCSGRCFILILDAPLSFLLVAVARRLIEMTVGVLVGGEQDFNATPMFKSEWH